MPPKWKLNRVTPIICDRTKVEFTYVIPETGEEITEIREEGCVYHHMWDVLRNPWLPPVVVSMEKICPAHVASTGAAEGKLLWADGKWKDLEDYQDYQRKWFLWLGNVKWKARVRAGLIPASETMPQNNAKWPNEPPTSGTVITPSQAEIDDMGLVSSWVLGHMDRFTVTKELFMQELGITTEEQVQLFDAAWIWRMEGHGDNRLLYVSSFLLANSQISRVEASLDIQFGPGKVVVEG